MMLGYGLICYLFNFNLLHYAIHKIPDRIVVYGEWPTYEYVAEVVYQNILAARNPFTSASTLYPFGWRFAMDDVAPINGVYFLFLRPFFNIHDSFTLIVLGGLIANSVAMYLLLRIIGRSRATAYLVSFIYAYTPFVIARLGHPTYTAIYIFPLFAWAFLRLYYAKTILKKIASSVLLGVISAAITLTNLYYLIMVLLMSIVLAIYTFIGNRSHFHAIIKENARYFFLTAITALILLSPWLIKVYQAILFDDFSAPVYVDTEIFSADLTGLILPGTSSTILGKFIEYVSTQLALSPRFENFIYPGIIILLTLIYISVFRRRITPKTFTLLKPLLVSGAFFWLLTLGPTLKIFGTKTGIPLPYNIINHLPIIQMARAPGRFIVVFVFFISIAASLILDEIRNKNLQTKLGKNLLYIAIFMLFLVDQSYVASFTNVLHPIPSKTYAYIKNQPSKGPLLEIPFVIRDGLKSYGDYNYVWYPRTQPLHGKPTFSVYGGRINDDIFKYYANDPLIGRIGKIIDPSQESKKVAVSQEQLSAMIESADFLNIGQVLLKTDETYSASVQKILLAIGFKMILSDTPYALFSRKVNNVVVDSVDMSTAQTERSLVQGWGEKEPNGRWVVGKVASVIFRTAKSSTSRLKFAAASPVENQRAMVFIDREKVATVTLKSRKTVFDIPLENLDSGIHIIAFVFSETFQPAAFDRKSKDNRDLSVFFTKIMMDYTK